MRTIDDAAGMLIRAFDAGYPRRDALETNPHLARLRNHPRIIASGSASASGTAR